LFFGEGKDILIKLGLSLFASHSSPLEKGNVLEWSKLAQEVECPFSYILPVKSCTVDDVDSTLLLTPQQTPTAFLIVLFEGFEVF